MIGRRVCTPRKLFLFTVTIFALIVLYIQKKDSPLGHDQALLLSPEDILEQKFARTTRNVVSTLASNQRHFSNTSMNAVQLHDSKYPDHKNPVASSSDLRWIDLKEIGIEMRDDPYDVRFRVVESMNEMTAEETFHSYVSQMHIECKRHVRLGNVTDGGWDMCIAGPFRPPNDSCVVYSFGIGDNWSFDDDVSKRFGCTVRSFDPSINQQQHQRSDRIWFYPIGIGAGNTNSSKGWKLMPLQEIISMCQDDGKTIDYLKIDIESHEWDALEDLLRHGDILRRVKQLAIEIHTKELDRIQSTVQDLHRYWTILHGLEKAGFWRWYWHFNLWGFFPSRTLEKYLSCCYEMVYVNVNYLS